MQRYQFIAVSSTGVVGVVDGVPRARGRHLDARTYRRQQTRFGECQLRPVRMFDCSDDELHAIVAWHAIERQAL